uniref:Uncharacterized protein n=1 Tax=Arundo donax TaxID=35708 RepID=A0A0A8Y6R6_ARUDO
MPQLSLHHYQCLKILAGAYHNLALLQRYR